MKAIPIFQIWNNPDVVDGTIMCASCYKDLWHLGGGWIEPASIEVPKLDRRIHECPYCFGPYYLESVQGASVLVRDLKTKAAA